MYIIKFITGSIIFIFAVYGFKITLDKILDFFYEKYLIKERSQKKDECMKRVRDTFFNKIEILDEFSHRTIDDIYVMKLKFKKTGEIANIEFNFECSLINIPEYDIFTDTEKEVLIEYITQIITKKKKKKEKNRIEEERIRIKKLREKHLED